MGAKVLGESFGAPGQLKIALEAFVENWNLLLAHPSQWSYDGKDLPTKAVKRFTTMLRNSAEAMEPRTLTKLTNLMTNMLQDYFSKVIQPTWCQLAEALALQSEVLTAIIQREEGPRRKKNLQLALEGLNAALEKRSVSAIREAA